MKKLHILTLAIAAALVSTLAFAQTAAPRMQAKPDANADGVITKEEAAKFPRLAEKFAQLDKDKDGKLSGGELPMHRAGMRGQAGGMRGQHDGMRALDSDGDGRISRAEMQAGKSGMDQRFAQMDVNKDGYIDKADRQARMAQRRAECFGKADADKNGQLSRAEFDRMGEVCGHGRDGKAGRMSHDGHPAQMPKR
ncbi:EF-hand domain-containing protein [Thermomonas fusca]|uniref:EF-hand domain-containing protein n=1 Tax=Thermomonas fusca TaxID=215690 RepID=A0A5R9PEX3_9GAMM|nr:EF-hand domain-containing protein [Thermomonas fusca]TLX21573.1 EF-hand domain-containing protein [Thermomonas fusca]